MDFVSDALFDGRRLRALTLLDVFTREALAIEEYGRISLLDILSMWSSVWTGCHDLRLKYSGI